jgi:hypothetical protein
MRGRTFRRNVDLGKEEEEERDRRARREEAELRGSRRGHEADFGRGPKEFSGKLETRIAALERDRAALEKERWNDKTKAGLSTELRRLQSGVSAFDHPGLYSHIDQMVTMHEAPPTHRGPMTVAGATGNVLKVLHIKLSYLADAIWEYTRRQCAKGGEHLTDLQILEIESRVMEFFGKQKVEAGKILDKAGITPGRGGR